MAFGTELADFVSAFNSTYIPKRERDAMEAETEWKRTRAEAAREELEEWRENKGTRRRATELDLEGAERENLRGAVEWEEFQEDTPNRRRARQIEIEGLERQNSPENVERAKRAVDVEAEQGEAAARLNRSQAAKNEYDLWKEEEDRKEKQRRTMLRLGVAEEDLPKELKRTDPPSPGPQSAVEGGPRISNLAGLEDTPVTTGELEPHQLAFLDTVASPESRGLYNIRYTPEGGAMFDLSEDHPRIFEPTHGGKKSSAAGRYQFTATTWDDVTGGADFTPRNQDLAAWDLAQRDYKLRTGRDLDTDLRKGGVTPTITRALSPTWAGLKGKADSSARLYQQRLMAYSGGAGADELGSYSPAFAAIEAIDRGSKEDIALSGRKIVKQSLLRLASSFGLDQPGAVQDPDRQVALGQYLEGEGAADPDEVEEVKNIVKKVSPKDLTEAEVNLATLVVSYEDALYDGDLETAQATAGSILQLYRQSSSQYLAIAQAAMEEGEEDEAIKNLVKAYAFIPNGRDVDIQKKGKGFQVEIKDIASGETTFKELVPPDVMYAQLMNMGPANFDQQLMAAAGVRPDTKGRTELSEAYLRKHPEHKGLSREEVAELRLQEAAKRGTGEPPDFNEVMGGEDGEGGFRAALGEMLTLEQHHPQSGKTVPGTSLQAQMEQNGITPDEFAEWQMGIETLAYDAINAGFRGDHRLLAEFLVNATSDVSGTAPYVYDETQGVARWKDIIEIPVTPEMHGIISGMLGDAMIKHREQQVKGSMRRTRQGAVETQERLGAATEEQELRRRLSAEEEAARAQREQLMRLQQERAGGAVIP